MFIVIRTGTFITSLAMRSTLDACLAAAHAVMDKYGNVYMFPDPYRFKMPSQQYTGLAISAHSTIVPGLKWTDLVDALNGIKQIMLEQGIFAEALLQMYDDPSGVEMGVAHLYRSSAISRADHDGLT